MAFNNSYVATDLCQFQTYNVKFNVCVPFGIGNFGINVQAREETLVRTRSWWGKYILP